MCGARRAWRWKPTAPLGAQAVEIVAPDALPTLREALDAPSKYLRAPRTARGKDAQELVTLALIKLAGSDATSAATQLDSKWGVHLSPEERNWAWGVMGKQAAQRSRPMPWATLPT
jgi:soluble lytic murein transglycosylase